MAAKKTANLRAYCCQTLRGSGRLPAWLDDAGLARMFLLDRIWPVALPRRMQALLGRPLGICPKCLQRRYVGCVYCFNGVAAPAGPLDQVRHLLRLQRVVASWLTVSAASRFSGLPISQVARLDKRTYYSADGICPYCAQLANPSCLACLCRP